MAEFPDTRPYDLLIFDWDGTLLDSVGTIVGCTQETLAELGQPVMSEEGIRDLIGLGLRETVETLAPGCDEELYQAILATYRRRWNEAWHGRSEPFRGVRTTLERLRDQGYLMAVATAKGRAGLRQDMGRADFDGLFVASRTVDEAQSKPHPEMVLDLVDELGLEPRDALVIGDTVHDLQMACNAGVSSVAVTTGAQPRGVLEEEGPLVCLDSVNDLPDWLETAGRGSEHRPSREETTA